MSTGEFGKASWKKPQVSRDQKAVIVSAEQREGEKTFQTEGAMCQGPGVREREMRGGVGGGVEWREIRIDWSKNGGRPTHTELAGSLGCPRSPLAPSCDGLAGKRKITFLFSGVLCHLGNVSIPVFHQL